MPIAAMRNRRALNSRSCLLLSFGVSIGASLRSVSSPHFRIAIIRAANEETNRQEHVHDCLDFVLPLDGAYYSEALGFDRGRSGRQLLYTPPSVAHRDKMETRGSHIIKISVANAMMGGLSGEATLPGSALALERDAALHCAHRMAARLCDAEFGANELDELGHELIGAIATPRRPEETLSGSVRHGVRVLRNLEPGAAVSIEAIARAAGAHPVYFARAFRRAMGCTPSQFAMRLRVLRVAAELRSGRNDLAMLACEHGFVDQSHLSKSFKAVLGATPGRYRASFH
jgi:AraC family transcriptional regulator